MTHTTTLNPRYQDAVRMVFEEANFVTDVGVRLVDMGLGWVETALDVQPKHFQHTGFVHAGVQATIADHTAGCAATTLLKPDEYVLSANISLNMLRPASGQLLRCRATVLKPGRRIVVVESEVFAIDEDNATLVVKATITLAVLRRR